LETLETHTKPARVLEYSREGDFLVSCGSEKSIMITDTTTNKLRQFYDNALE